MLFRESAVWTALLESGFTPAKRFFAYRLLSRIFCEIDAKLAIPHSRMPSPIFLLSKFPYLVEQLEEVPNYINLQLHEIFFSGIAIRTDPIRVRDALVA